MADSRKVTEGASPLVTAHSKATATNKPHLNHIISDDKATSLLTTLHKVYIDVLGGNGLSHSMYSVQSLAEKIKRTNRPGKVVFPKQMSLMDTIAVLKRKTLSEVLVEQTALSL